MTETTKLKLLKPDIGDQYNIANFNTNADIIDAYATSNDLAVEKAKTDAISTASADATNKANTAQDNAINTASQDATNKINTSNSVRNIKTYTDFSQIGIDVNNPAVTMLDIYKAIPPNSQFCSAITGIMAFYPIFPSAYGTFIGQRDGNYCSFTFFDIQDRGQIYTAAGADNNVVSQWFKQATTAYTDSVATDAVAQAKTYADVVATNAVVQANAYTDTKLGSAVISESWEQDGNGYKVYSDGTYEQWGQYLTGISPSFQGFTLNLYKPLLSTYTAGFGMLSRVSDTSRYTTPLVIDRDTRGESACFVRVGNSSSGTQATWNITTNDISITYNLKGKLK